MLTPKCTEMAETFIKAKVYAKETFTAFDITLLLRQGGQIVKHDDVKVYVHQEMRTSHNEEYDHEYFTHPIDGWTALQYKPLAQEENDQEYDSSDDFYIKVAKKDTEDDESYHPNTGSEVADFLISTILSPTRSSTNVDETSPSINLRNPHAPKNKMAVGTNGDAVKKDDKPINIDFIDVPKYNNHQSKFSTMLQQDKQPTLVSDINKTVKLQTQNRITIPKKILKSYFPNYQAVYLYITKGQMALSSNATNRFLYTQGYTGPSKFYTTDNVRLTLEAIYTGAKISMFDPANDYLLITLY